MCAGVSVCQRVCEWVSVHLWVYENEYVRVRECECVFMCVQNMYVGVYLNMSMSECIRLSFWANVCEYVCVSEYFN